MTALDRHRRSVRLRDHNYAGGGSYFVTLCTYQRDLLFGSVVDGQVTLTDCGRLASDCWQALPVHYADTTLGEWVVMPNHVHGILHLTPDGNVGASCRGLACQAPNQGTAFAQGTACRAPTEESGIQRTFGVPQAGSLGTIIGAYKSAVTRRIHHLAGMQNTRVWQRNYWEHIVRNQREMDALCDYIYHNPANWDQDTLSP